MVVVTNLTSIRIVKATLGWLFYLAYLFKEIFLQGLKIVDRGRVLIADF
jgi:hypothetical protein